MDMTKPRQSTKPAIPGTTALRRRAEEITRGNESLSPENLDGLTAEAMRQALQELRVHQVELELQNEELRRAQDELEASRARYFDLYDLAPVGYVTLSEKGMIQEANLTVAGLLGVARGDLVKQPLTRFILREDQDIHYRHWKPLLETGAPQVYEMRMRRGEYASFWARLEAKAALDDEGAPVGRIVVSDITRRIRAEQAEKDAAEALRKSHDALEDRVKERTTEVRLLSARIVGAQEEERKRIARDLHDGIGGLLSAIKYKFEAARGPEAVGEVIPYLQQAIDDCRRIQMALRPSLLDELGLLPTLTWLARESQKRSPGLRVENRLELEEDAIPLALRTVIFRITQEALNNITRHSQADRVRLSLRSLDGTLELVVRDNGQGFEKEKESDKTHTELGYGLAIMRERAEWSGGVLSILSGPGEGTIVRACWPGKAQEGVARSGKKAPGSRKKKVVRGS